MAIWNIRIATKKARVKYERVEGVVLVVAAGSGFKLVAEAYPKTLRGGVFRMEPQSLPEEVFPDIMSGVEAAKSWLLSYDAEAWLAATA